MKKEQQSLLATIRESADRAGSMYTVPLPPQSPAMTVTLFGDGARGSAIQIYSNLTFGITLVARRKSRKEEFVEIWTSHLTGGDAVEFSSYDALRIFYNAIIEDRADESGENAVDG